MRNYELVASARPFPSLQMTLGWGMIWLVRLTYEWPYGENFNDHLFILP